MPGIFDQRVVLVTGAAGGIGLATSLIMAAEGARIVLSDLSDSAGASAIEVLGRCGFEAEFIQVDVASEESVSHLVAQVVDRYGRLDCAFNNAGIEHRGIPLTELSLEQWERCISIDLTGVFLCMKHQIPAMVAGGGGSIVNNSAGMVETAIPFAAEYIAAKHGVVGLTRAAAVEFGHLGVRVNAVLPGPVKTGMLDRVFSDTASQEALSSISGRIPMRRIGEPDEVGEAVAWLLSEKSSFVNGACLSVDGGFVIS